MMSQKWLVNESRDNRCAEVRLSSAMTTTTYKIKKTCISVTTAQL